MRDRSVSRLGRMFMARPHRRALAFLGSGFGGSLRHTANRARWPISLHYRIASLQGRIAVDWCGTCVSRSSSGWRSRSSGGGGGALMAARVRHRQNRLIVRSFSGRCPSRRTITRSPLRHDGVESATLFSPLQPRHVMAPASASCTGHSIWRPMFIGTGSSMIGSGSATDFCARSGGSHHGFLADKQRCVVGR